MHLAAFMLCEDEVHSEVHDQPAAEEERTTYERTTANIIAQKAVPWRRFLTPTSPHRQDVINAFEPSPVPQADASLGELDKDLMTHLVTDFIAQQLQDVSLEQVLSQLPEHSRFESLGSPMVKQETKPRFKPLKIHKLPSGPNSVFNLAQSMAM